MKKSNFTILFLCVILLAILIYGSTSTAYAAQLDIFDDVSDLVVGVKPTEEAEQVYLGGYPVGLTIDGNGVTVIGLNEFLAEDGKLSCPALVAGLQINDVIVAVDGKSISGSARLSEIVSQCKGKALEIEYDRDGQRFSTRLLPRKDITAGNYRAGIWTRDSSCGIGTLTYVRRNLSFGCLGHPVTDSHGSIVPCKNGGVFQCEINGVEPSKSGAAGELMGTICYDKRLGSIYANNKLGTYGTLNRLPSFCKDSIAVANISEVKPGVAEIYCTLDDGIRNAYKIEIIKAVRQSSKDDKGIVFRVVDKNLLAKTAGIVQGMSGSPIVQEGKLVGAVTHVFVNDPTKGYGVYAKWMLTN